MKIKYKTYWRKTGLKKNWGKIFLEIVKEHKPNGFLGINIGPNKDTLDRVDDYLNCFKKFYNFADYITINISSPNTPDLRNLHSYENLDELLNLIQTEKKNLNTKIPLALKVSPDIEEENISEISDLIMKHKLEIIIVSNSDRSPVDKFAIEKNAIKNYARFANKKILIVHQKDLGVSRSFQNAEYNTILDENGIVKSGKAEGMIIGTLMAKWLGKKYLGFVDSDNYFPGSVLEYIKEYAAGFSINNENNVLVRISWHSKPKVTDNKLFFQKWGRSSKNTNMVLNKLLTHYTGYETEIIKTGNAGEHALTMSLALQLDFASGYGIETNHFVNLFEKWGEVTEGKECNEKAIICQIESRNPHLHEDKGNEHIDDMIDVSLSVIYNSNICPVVVKNEILENIKSRRKEGEIKNIVRYPALCKYCNDFITHWEGLDLNIYLNRP